MTAATWSFSTRPVARTKVSDLDAAVTEVEAAGGMLVKRGEHAPGVPFAYIRDPDGYLIELS